MKQRLTVSLDKELLRRVRVLASRRGTRVSALLAGELRRLVGDEMSYEQAKARALARLNAPFRLGEEKPATREELHER